MEESSKQYWNQKNGLLGEEEEEEEEFMTMMGGELLDERTVYAPADYSNNKHHQGGEDAEEEEPRRRQESMVNKLISTVYSGPTISDVESALSFTGGGDHLQQLKYISPSPAVFSPEKVMENKYTLKMKTCGNGLAEDGYKWRKYGQKSIKNSPNPRSYYRCTNPRCNAKKQVERATDEPDTLVVTYEGLHLHYTYSHFLHAAQDQAQQQQGLPKKPKRANTSHGDEVSLSPPSLAPLAAGDAFPVAEAAAWGYSDEGDERQQQQQQQMEDDMPNNGGLLEDVVPLLVRRPCGSTTTTPGSPPSNNNSSVSLTPYIDMAILNNIF